MDNLQRYFDTLSKFGNQPRAIDTCHNLFLFGCLVARKPREVLEVGLGTGYVTLALIHGLSFNGIGNMTCVDNWADWKGVEPSGVQTVREAGVRVIAPMDEETFVRSAPDDAYDFVVADGDHRRSHAWVDEYLRITRHDGFLFFHDTNSERFTNLHAIGARIAEMKLPHYHFTESTRSDEQCTRGWLFVINQKSPPAAVPE